MAAEHGAAQSEADRLMVLLHAIPDAQCRSAEMRPGTWSFGPGLTRPIRL
jgi:hypothetical protein